MNNSNTNVIVQSVIDLAKAAKLALEIVYEREQARLDKAIADGEELLKDA
jgi:hypothetical protein